LLEFIKGVDKVYIVDDTDMVNFLKTHKPHFWIKGNDYNLETLNQEERLAIESYGGKILFCPLVDGISSTNILNKI